MQSQTGHLYASAMRLNDAQPPQDVNITQLVCISKVRTFIGKIAGMVRSLGKAFPISIRPAAHGKL